MHSLFVEHIFLLLQRVEQGRFGFEQRADLFQRNAEKLEDHDLLQPCEVSHGVEPIARMRTLLGTKQSQAVVMMQGSDGDTSDSGKFLGKEQFSGCRLHGLPPRAESRL